MRRLFAPVVLGAGLAACSPPPPAHAPAASDPPVAVSVATVDTSDWPTFVEAGGVLRAQTTAVISTRLLAPVTAVHVRAGDRVRRGQALVELDAAAAQAEAARATASFEAARLAVQAAEAERSGARAGVVLARATHDRIRRLADTKSATAQELDEAVAGLAAAESRDAAAAAGVAHAMAALAAAKAGADAGGIAASYGTLTAPFDGVVARRDVDPGSMATPGSTLLVVDDPRGLRLEVDLDATRVTALAAGQPALVRIDADSRSPLPESTPGVVEGRIAEIARLDAGLPAFRVKVDVPASAAWRSGLFGRARFRVASRPAVTLPAAAVVRRGQLTLAFVAGDDGIARLRTVRLGDEQADRVEVLAGLAAGERVIVDPPAALADGARISAAGTAPGNGR